MSCDSINQSVSITTVLQTISKFADIARIVRKLPCLAMLSYFFEVLLSMKFGFKKSDEKTTKKLTKYCLMK